MTVLPGTPFQSPNISSGSFRHTDLPVGFIASTYTAIQGILIVILIGVSYLRAPMQGQLECALSLSPREYPNSLVGDVTRADPTSSLDLPIRIPAEP